MVAAFRGFGLLLALVVPKGHVFSVCLLHSDIENMRTATRALHAELVRATFICFFPSYTLIGRIFNELIELGFL